MKAWMALDPETLRVTIQVREFQDGDFPPGLRGYGWPLRTAELDEEVWATVSSGEIGDAENDELHRNLWSENGETPWPNA